MIEFNAKTFELIIDDESAFELAMDILKAREDAKKRPASAPWASFSKAVVLSGDAPKTGAVTVSVLSSYKK